MSGTSIFDGGQATRVGLLAMVFVFMLSIGLWLAQPAAAVPIGTPALNADSPPEDPVFGDVTCEGAVREADQSEPEPEPEATPSGATGPTGPTDEEEEEEPPYIVEDLYEYEFSCDKEVYAYTVATNREVGSFDTETIGLLPNGDPAPGLDGGSGPVGEDFFCLGGIPAFGVGCYASPSKTPAVRLNIGNSVTGRISLDAPLCSAYDQPQFSVVVLTELGSYNDADTTKPPVVKGPWVVTSEPISLDTTAIECDRLVLLKGEVRSAVRRKGRLYETALQSCAAVSRSTGRKARSKARTNCAKATKAARRFKV
ncbi:MAG: hypothetical protein WD181_02715 [Solirubrobacterales bacterium]